jgi:predicted ATPase/class 3 adenylate cyclase
VDLPTGTVSFLFTDVEGSTRLWEEHPAAMAIALARHDVIVRNAIGAHRGAVFASSGDGVAAAFANAADATNAAIAAQRALRTEQWTDGIDIRVRMGVHTGEADERNGDYFGQPVNRAARLMGAAHGGQVVVSDVTAELTGVLPGIELVDLGSHRLKGLVEPMQVYGVAAADLGWLDRPLAAEQAVRGNLPGTTDDLIGREQLLAQADDDLRERRLLTLTGPGGVGKTRAAIELGRRTSARFGGGVWVVELAPIAGDDVVTGAVATALGARPQPGTSMAASIIEWLSGRPLLLILDNCEHVLDDVAELVDAVLAGCPLVTVVATSREPLGVMGERVLAVSSLDQVHAIELFRERATAADASLELSDGDIEIVARICDRLDGIPLAIELAASRVRSLTIADLSARLDDRFRLLRGRGRATSERHHTLWATVAWSYQLLGVEERVLFERVSVFAGGFDLHDAEVVSTGPTSGAIIDSTDVFDLLGSLVDKSMIVADRSRRAVRYRVLETLRQFGDERLVERGDNESVRDRHLAHFLDVAQAARTLEMGPDQLRGDEVMEREWDNIRAALGWAVERGRMMVVDELLWATFPFAVLQMRYEAGDWADRLLSDDSEDNPVTSRIIVTAAAFAMFAAEWERSLPLCRLTIERSTQPEPEALAWHSATISSMMLGRVDDAKVARDHAQQALAETDDPFTTYWVLYSGMMVATSTDRAALPTWIERLSEHAARHGAPWMMPAAYMAQGNLRLAADDFGGAAESFRTMLSAATAAGSMLDEGMAAARFITASLAPSDAFPDEETRDMLIHIRDTRSWTVAAPACEPIANRLARRGRLASAAVMLGGLTPTPPGTHRMRQRAETLALVSDLPDMDGLIARGATMTPGELVDYVIDQLPL